jgi:arsenite-transporting ATPase
VSARRGALRQRWRFFSGKGGVGKTTLAAAYAIRLARRGARVLCVSTDPAHSLGDALETRLSARPRAIPLGGKARSSSHSLRAGKARTGALFAAELDADAALARWLRARRRAFHAIAVRGTYLDEEDVDELFDLSLPGVDELIGLVELARLAGARGAAGGYDALVVDAAPTGHTLRLLEMPRTLARLAAVLDDMQEKHRTLAQALGRGGYAADFADAAIAEVSAQAEALAGRLRDPARCDFSWVIEPALPAVAEGEDGVRALRKAGVAVAELVVNRIAPAKGRACAACFGRREEEARAIAAARRSFRGIPFRFVAEAADEPRGVDALAEIRRLARPPKDPGMRPGTRRVRTHASRRDERAVLEQVAPAGTRLLLFGGKGGVGKTTCAAAAALLLARTGSKVLLLSTDPAHSLGDVLGAKLSDEERQIPGAPASLLARELDAPRAFAARRERYQKSVDELFDGLRGGSRFDASLDRAVVRDLIDLSPPGLDELFAVLALIDALLVDPSPRFETVVVDTAPTGHTLRLLRLQETALGWTHALLALLLKYRGAIGLGDAAANLTQTARELRQLGELLRDPARTRFVAVTRAASLPALETRRLLDGLRRLRIPAPLLLVNGLTPEGCSRCGRASERERSLVAELRASKAARGCAMLSALLLSPAPRAAPALIAFARTWS